MSELTKVAKSTSEKLSRGKLKDYVDVSYMMELEIHKLDIELSLKNFEDSINSIEEEYRYYSVKLEKNITAALMLPLASLSIVLATRNIKVNNINYLSYGLISIFIIAILTKTVKNFHHYSVCFYALEGLRKLKSTLLLTDR